MTQHDPAVLAKQHADDVDGQHHLQLELLQAFAAAAGVGSDSARLEEIVDQLIDFTQMHFAAEQMLMRLYSYDHYQAHQAEHDATLDRIEALRPGGSGDTQALAAPARELGDAILKHIRSSDRAFSAYLAGIAAIPQHGPAHSGR